MWISKIFLSISRFFRLVYCRRWSFHIFYLKQNQNLNFILLTREQIVFFFIFLIDWHYVYEFLIQIQKTAPKSALASIIICNNCLSKKMHQLYRSMKMIFRRMLQHGTGETKTMKKCWKKGNKNKRHSEPFEFPFQLLHLDDWISRIQQCVISSLFQWKFPLLASIHS